MTKATKDNKQTIDGKKVGSLAGEQEKRVILAREVLPDTLPIIPISNRPLFPKMVVPMVVDDKKAKRVILDLADSSSKFVGVVLRRSTEPLSHSKGIEPKDLFSIGVVARVVRARQETLNESIQVMLAVIERFAIVKILSTEPKIVAQVRYLSETEMTVNEELRAYSVAIINSIKELLKLNPLFKEELHLFLNQINLKDPGRLADFSASMTTSSGSQLQEILEAISIRQRIEKVLVLLKKEIDVSKIQVKINKQIEEKLTKQQRQFFLREQLKAIKKELGITKEGKEAEIERFKQRVNELTLSDEAAEQVNQELNKLQLLEPVSPEFNVTRNYLDWLTSLPWGIYTKENYDIKQAEKILNRDHYGLEDVKERILEFLSIGILKGKVTGSIICFVGPPGVGKTSMGKAIAASLSRKFFRFSLGGIRDEAEIKGHRRTYIGALPGKFIQAMRHCKSANPLIMLDEVDKIGASFQGDPASALLEVLDPEQNSDFLDHYLDVRFDLSNVLFITTANVLDTIPRPLLDRMEVIKLSGYILEEKLGIAKRHLISKQLELNGLKKKQLSFSTAALREIIDGYAREPGVRGLENHIKKICRKTAKQIITHKVHNVIINPDTVSEFLGKRIFSGEDPFKKIRIGVIMGLAWTSMGGETVYVEAAKVEANKPGFKQTGQLGNVMVESAEIAYTFVRSFLDKDSAASRMFQNHFIHLHVPSGATPKDGPSAGITMASALYSLAINRPIRKRVAMTGELTLTGLVMSVGGIKEKTIAAKRAKVKDIIFPKGNEHDFTELPAYIRAGLTPRFINTFAELIELCFDHNESKQDSRTKSLSEHKR